MTEQKDLSVPITQAEMIELFGHSLPMEVVELLYDSPDTMTYRELRAKLREIVEKKKITEVINHTEALHYALMTRETSNLARCYVKARELITRYSLDYKL